MSLLTRRVAIYPLKKSYLALILLWSVTHGFVGAAFCDFLATLSATDVVDDGNPNRIEVASRTTDIPFTEPHNVPIVVTITFERAVEPLIAIDFETYYFDRADALIKEKIELRDNNITKMSSKTYILTIPADKIPQDAMTLILELKRGAVKSVTRADIEARIAGKISSLPQNTGAAITLHLVKKEPDYPDNLPKVVSIARYDSSGFLTLGITGSFIVRVVLTERPRTFTSSHIGITNARVDRIQPGVPFTEKPPPHEGGYATATDVPFPSGRDARYYPYYVDITPELHDAADIVIEINDFKDTAIPANEYLKVYTWQREGRNRLTVRISPSARFRPKPSGFPVSLPHTHGASIPANGFYILTKKSAHSGIDVPPVEEGPLHRKPRQLSYNVRESHALPNLEGFLVNGGTIDLVGPTNLPAGSVVISEILWGSDDSLADATESQWIEIYNTTGARLPIAAETWFLRFYAANEPIPHPRTPGILDRVGTLSSPDARVYGASGGVPIYWSIAGKGQGGRTGGGLIESLISMERLIYTTGEVSDGTKAENWTASIPPSSNVDLSRSGAPFASPGTLRFTPAPVPVVPSEPIRLTPDQIDLVISEIMYTVGKSRLPQWIELHNRSPQEVNLQGWRLRIENSPGDKTVLSADITLTLGEVLVDAGKAVLLVTEPGRHSGIGERDGDLRRDRVIVLKPLLDAPAPRYKLLSDVAFKLRLFPPAARVATDTVGNLGATPAWALPTIEGESRSSLLRNYRYSKNRGMTVAGWRLAAAHAYKYAQHITYYGHHSDHGTPGYRGGYPLPVTLSSFSAVRETSTSGVVVRWTTESETDNAGFHIFRNTFPEGVFRRITPSLILGAGTIGEKRQYRFTDTTAAPNVGYAYRLVDVSFGGASRTLATVRLKGTLSSVGKGTTTWGHLKTQN